MTANTTVGGTLGVTGATSLSSTLAVTGAATLNSTLAVTGATTLGGTLAVTGDTTLGNLTVSGDLTGGTRGHLHHERHVPSPTVLCTTAVTGVLKTVVVTPGGDWTLGGVGDATRYWVTVAGEHLHDKLRRPGGAGRTVLLRGGEVRARMANSLGTEGERGRPPVAVLVLLAVSVALNLALAVLALSRGTTTANPAGTSDSTAVSRTSWQAVFLTDNEAFVGHVTNLGPSDVTVQDVYFLGVPRGENQPEPERQPR